MISTDRKSASRRLPNRRGSEAFALDASRPDFAATASRVIASNAVITPSLSLQFGPVETLCTAVYRDARGTATGSLRVAVDMLAGESA
jgi:hypothetical protein